MAQAKRNRRRKHRGTQAGTVERRGRTGRAQTQAEAKQISRRGGADRASRELRPPTWRGSAVRALIAAVLFGVVAIFLLDQPPLSGVLLAAIMVLVYLPVGYYTDRFMYRRRQRAAGRA